jgi:parallel beta helix pectate lyase-like protein
VTTALHLTGGIVAHEDYGVPRPLYIHDQEFVGDGAGYGIYCDRSYVVFERCVVRGFYLGVVLANAVRVTFRDCYFARNVEANLFIPGHTVATCVVFDACAFRESNYGLTIQAGQGISFVNRCVVESNRRAGLVIDPSPSAPFFGDIAQSAAAPIWFENNGTDLVGGMHLARR